jgi:multicomponent Na+:H+ antiporter subunit G
MNILVAVVLILGLAFFLGGTVGILRFPDFYTRLHAAGKLDTLGSLLAMIALALFNLEALTVASLLTSAKFMLAVVFLFLASPTATHAIADAGIRAGQKGWNRTMEGGS